MPRLEGRYGDEQLRAQFLLLAESTTHLASADGVLFLRQIEQYLVPGLLAMSRQIGIDQSWVQPNEIVNTVLVGLCENDSRVARKIAGTADDPWAYLASCAGQWVRALWGTRGDSLDALIPILTLAEPVNESALTPLCEVVELSHALLAPYLEVAQRAQLQPLLRWIAANPPQRISHESADRMAAFGRFSAFTYLQIVAILNICWGGRPRRRETSIMAAFLLDPGFDLHASASHTRALLKFRRAVRYRELRVVGAWPLAA